MEKLAKVFGSRARLKMLRLFIFNRATAFTLDEITERTKLSKEVVRKEIAELLAAGFLKKKGTKNPLAYQTNPKYEHIDAFETFIRETTSVRPERIVSELRRAGPLRFIALSGFFTGLMEPQIDLLIVGDNVEERTLGSAVHTLEAELGREIRYAFFPTTDFRYRLGVYDRLLRDVFDYPHRILVDKIGV